MNKYEENNLKEIIEKIDVLMPVAKMDIIHELVRINGDVEDV